MIDGISASSNPWASGVMGIQAGTSLLNSSANTIARQSITATDSTGSSSSLSLNDLTTALTQQKEGLYQVKASAKGIEIANKTLDSLFKAIA